MQTQGLNRRQFIRLSTAGVLGGSMGMSLAALEAGSLEGWDPGLPFRNPAKPITIQPLFMYAIPVRKEEASWRSWGGAQTEEAVAEEVARIDRELAAMAGQAEFPMKIQPVRKVKTVEEARQARDPDPDVVLVYANTGSGELLKACFSPKTATLIFVRQKSGPIYYWYEALSVKYLETSPAGGAPGRTVPEGGVHVDDVVVDDYAELLWRLRALSGVANLKGTRVVALGGPWGKYSPEAPRIAREKFGLEIVDSSYDDLAARIRRANADPELMRTAEKWVDQYLALPKTVLHTQRQFVTNAFVLYRIFKDLLRETGASVFTIKSCMGTVIPMSKTTACLSLELLNDEGGIAFCESDFVVIPAGILMRYLSAKPVFLHNSTFPHQGRVTCSHCTCPRRMDGRRYEPADIVTHYESDYGAAPKIEMPIGQEVSFVDPEYSVGRWVGFKGIVRDNPSYACCRSQQDVEIQGNWRQLLNEVRDSHWLMVYGDYLKEASYAARKLGVVWAGV